MPNIFDIASYLVKEHKNVSGEEFNGEIRLHKLLYFAQKESLSSYGIPLFDNEIKGWKHGPVIPELRGFLKSYDSSNTISLNCDGTLNELQKQVIETIIHRYSHYTDWKLRDLSHLEGAWIKSRCGLNIDDKGTRVITVNDIMEDCEMNRKYNYQFDMYMDEFDEYNPDDFQELA